MVLHVLYINNIKKTRMKKTIKDTNKDHMKIFSINKIFKLFIKYNNLTTEVLICYSSKKVLKIFHNYTVIYYSF